MTASRTEALQESPAHSRSLGLGGLIRRRPETITFILLVAICITVAVINPAFLQPSTLIDIGRASVVMGLFALGVFIILAAGGIDVSFTAIAAFTMYSMTVLVQSHLPGIPIALVLLMSIAGGALLGIVNGLLVHHLAVPSLIVTIGTQYLFRGILLSFIGTVWIMSLPPQMGAFGRLPLFQFEAANGATITLPAYFLVLPVAAILTWFILNRTLMGRAIFAVGGNADIASRLGYDLKTIHIFLFGYAGALAGLAGIIHVCANRQANPFDLVGTEINVIAAVVLGGAKITGGTGTVLGTILGVLLVVVINSVLVMVGIPSTWQRLVVGVFILLAAAFFVTRQKNR
ncbi:simple sugar transport system permease protein [Rhizobium sp. BK529]|uniref:ABC transporter permease n=1 Tax=unclassified Rhizobium TaxID=2613769 RepID=UPI00104AC12F|nr:MULTISPECIES: ABC transporter permease [unclassified Rhizobium]MBB3593903.1 simple sugar transport system permease protein [Rhizobium sp. BK529]TCS01360.1 monosaccharide ABC transporter membrane protein (CUT2 family) [Rhizobium sp. BK418]